jgi:hypothetical protein
MRSGVAQTSGCGRDEHKRVDPVSEPLLDEFSNGDVLAPKLQQCTNQVDVVARRRRGVHGELQGHVRLVGAAVRMGNSLAPVR